MKKGTKIIKVVGIGGSGGNSLSRMFKSKIRGVELIAINSDLQDLKKTCADKKIEVGRKITKGFGAGMNLKIGEKAARESQEEIKTALLGADVIFVVCGLGGGTGSGAAPIVTEIARGTNALVIAVITMPFTFEGSCRKNIAKRSLEKIKKEADTIFIISNDKILTQITDKTKLSHAFIAADEILRQAVSGISDLIVLPGLINVDFADIKTIMKDSGLAMFGVGKGRGENKAKEAAMAAINSPLLDFYSKRSNGILFNISGGKNLTLFDVKEAAKIITKNALPSAKIIFGAIQDSKNFLPDEVKITVITTGIKN